ncbi:hypothetical protein LCGC14_1937870 [marine sediment metagenome]|uniref:Uncharacterized protein n=1 Tax=marine sediment metagenome TaxID=412755 RepID=A0A0F9HZP1_9ZZZZ
MATYSPSRVVQREDGEGFPKIRVNDFNVAELLLQVITQLKIVSMKLDCLQADGDVIDDDEVDTLELQ